MYSKENICDFVNDFHFFLHIDLHCSHAGINFVDREIWLSEWTPQGSDNRAVNFSVEITKLDSSAVQIRPSSDVFPRVKNL